MQHLLCKPTRLWLMKSVRSVFDGVSNERLARRILVGRQAIHITRGAQIPSAKPPLRLNLVQWRQTLMGLGHDTCSTSPLCGLPPDAPFSGFHEGHLWSITVRRGVYADGWF
jgi:hypothetical protein